MNILTLLLMFQVEMFEPENIQKFADHLYAREDYAAALSEYRRYLFVADSGEQYIYERVVDCLTRLERYSEAISEASNITDHNRRIFTVGLIYFTAGALDSSRAYLQSVEVPYDSDARRLIGLGYAYEFNFERAATYITLPDNAPAYKKPALGALFSIVPGGGHLYTGRYGDGIYSLFAVGTAALLAYYYHDRDESIKFGFSLGAAILLYAGNIYGGINAVRNYNYNMNATYLQRAISDNQGR
jgi:tetratricopeptide (TPR) repeat protein